jgi:hypothetical protein
MCIVEVCFTLSSGNIGGDHWTARPEHHVKTADGPYGIWHRCFHARFISWLKFWLKVQVIRQTCGTSGPTGAENSCGQAAVEREFRPQPLFCTSDWRSPGADEDLHLFAQGHFVLQTTAYLAEPGETGI